VNIPKVNVRVHICRLPVVIRPPIVSRVGKPTTSLTMSPTTSLLALVATIGKQLVGPLRLRLLMMDALIHKPLVMITTPNIKSAVMCGELTG